jgi:hypothetical protein
MTICRSVAYSPSLQIARSPVDLSRVSIAPRLSISGKSLITPYGGGVVTMRGTNQGNWGENYSIDAANIIALGANVVRILIRWQGNYSPASVDSYDASAANGFLNPSNYAKFMQELDWLERADAWIIIAFDSDYGAGGRGLGNSYWNFFDTTDTVNQALYRAQFIAAWKKMAADNRRRKRVLAYELLPEPAATGSNASHGPIIKQFYRDVMDSIRTVDKNTPFLIGGRASYGINTMSEVYMSDRTDVIYTADFLTGKVRDEANIASNVESVALFRDTNNVPVLLQQVGRNTSDDDGDGSTSENLGLTAFNGVLSMMNAYGLHYTHWQYHQNSTNPLAYGLYYKTNANVDSADNWTPKLGELNSFAYHMTQSLSVMERDAIAAAQACGGELYYVKSDLSNVYQTQDQSTPVTAVGQTVGRINPVVGSTNMSQSTAAYRPVLVAGVNGYAMNFDATDDWLGLSSAYFDGNETDMAVIASGRSPAGTVNRVIFHAGTSGSTVRWPYLAVLATDEYSASWRGDDNVLQQCNSITPGDNRAFVCGARKAGSTKSVYLQGVKEGADNTVAPGSIASMTRARFGATTSGTNPFGGPLSLLFVCKNAVTDEQYRCISRFAAYLAGAPFRGAIPATPNSSLLV